MAQINATGFHKNAKRLTFASHTFILQVLQSDTPLHIHRITKRGVLTTQHQSANLAYVARQRYITKNQTLVAEFGNTPDRLMDSIENFVANSRPTLGGERFLTDKELSARLKVSRRTLQDYRYNGIIAYDQLGDKILYEESDIERMLAANYREAFRHVGT